MIGLLFVLAVALHGRLYALRPGPSRLTLFYLVVAAGGALGGLFTSLLAPILFDWIYEHAILLLAAALLLPHRPIVKRLAAIWRTTVGKVLASAILGIAAILAWLLSGATEKRDGEQVLGLVCALVVLGVAFIGARLAYVTVLALLMIGHGGWATIELSASGARSRTYFGVYSVVEPEGTPLRQLDHGTTIHCTQWLAPERRHDPTSYYGRSSGVGIALESAAADAEIGIVGLGTGTLACYRLSNQKWTFFEIDPQVLAYSRDGTFTFLQDCAPDARVVIGDARLGLAKERAELFDLLAIDAFSSDAIPLHLMTEEAFASYGSTLKQDGLLLVHISNRFINLAPMVSALAEASGWHGRLRSDEEELSEGLTPSVWIALSRDEDRLSRLEHSSEHAWGELPSPAKRAWSDDNASILPLIRW